jgi:uncharacterized OsmC-like protein
MNEPLYVARATVTPAGPLHRHAVLDAGAEAEFGVHGPIAELFKLSPARPLPLPVDYVVAATAGCMLGTLIGALEVRQVKLEPGAITARAEGANELKDGLPLLTSIRVHYTMRIPKGTREVVDRALSRHQDKCPTAATLKPAVAVSWTAEIEEQ